MAIIPWKPFFNIDRFFEDEDWFLPVLTKNKIFEPAMDLYETDKEVIAEINAPGYDSDKFEVSVNDGLLKIRGEMEEKKEEKKRNYWRKEIREGSFEKVVRLPTAVDENKVEATYEKGILRVVMPKIKKETKTEKKIKVKTK